MTAKIEYTPGENMAARELLAVLECVEEQFTVCRRSLRQLMDAALAVVDALDGHEGELSPRAVQALDKLENVVEGCL